MQNWKTRKQHLCREGSGGFAKTETISTDTELE